MLVPDLGTKMSTKVTYRNHNDRTEDSQSPKEVLEALTAREKANNASEEQRTIAIEKKKLSEEADRLVDAIAASGHSSKILARLQVIEKRLVQIESLESKKRPSTVAVAAAEIRDFVMKSLMDLPELFRSNVQLAKTKLGEHIGELTFTPVETPEGKAFSISGNWNLLPGKKDVVELVARDGSGQNYTFTLPLQFQIVR